MAADTAEVRLDMIDSVWIRDGISEFADETAREALEGFDSLSVVLCTLGDLLTMDASLL